MSQRSSHEGTASLTAGGIITRCNQCLAQTIGCPVENLLGTDITSHVALCDADRFQQLVEGAKCGKCGEIQGEIHFQQNDDTLVPALVTIRDSVVRGVRTHRLTAIDLSQRKRVERRLPQMETVVDSPDDAIVSITADGIILSSNPAAERMSGYSAEQIRGRSLLMLTPPEMANEVLKIIDKARHGESTSGYEGVLVRKNGDQLQVVLTISPIHESGEVVGATVAVHDVTDRKWTNRKLHHMEAIVESSDAAIVSTTIDGTILSWNPAAERLTGYTREEAQGHSIAMLTPASSLDEMAEVIEKIKRGESTIGHETTIDCKDGRQADISLIISPILDSTNQSIGISALMRDITESKSERKALREANEFNQQLLASAREGIVAYDRDLRLLAWNPRMEEITGIPARAILGKPMAEMLPAAKKWGIHAGRERALLGEVVNLPDLYIEPPVARQARWLSINCFPVRDSAGTVIAGIDFVRDITARKQTEIKLIEDEARLAEAVEFTETIIRASSVGIGTYNAASGQCVSANDALAKIIGCSLETALQQNFRKLASWRANGLLELAEIVLASKTPHRIEVHALSTFGKETWMDCALIPISVRVGSPHLLLMATDITEQKHLEDQFRQAQKMEAIGRLAGGVAHDFNNLLNVILGYSDLLLRAGPLDERQSKRITEIKKAGDRAALLTRQLLAFSRKQVLLPQVLKLNDIVLQITNMLQQLIGEDIKVERHFDSSLGLTKADPGQIEQVLMNLAVNARDAMPNGGRLSLETANVSLGLDFLQVHSPGLMPGEYVSLTVSDTGTGMDEATQQQIFEPFFTTKVADKGTGLGLSTVYGIVNQSLGLITVKSELGKGTSFTVYLPRVYEVQQPSTTTVSSPQNWSGSGTILVVEDHQQVRELARECLTLEGYTVLLACDSSEAITAILRHPEPIDLVVSDVVLPGTSGPELVAKLREIRPEINALLISGYSDEAILRKVVFDHRTDFLPKPFRPEDLIRKVHALLSTRNIPQMHSCSM